MRSKLSSMWGIATLSAVLAVAGFPTVLRATCSLGCHEGADFKDGAACWHFHRTQAADTYWTTGAIGGTLEQSEIGTQRDEMAYCTKECPGETKSWGEVDPYSDIIRSQNFWVYYCGSAT